MTDDRWATGDPLYDARIRAYRASGDRFEWVMDRHVVQPGRTFSEEAMDQLITEVTSFIAARIIERWERTGEPPTHFRLQAEVA